MNFLSCLLALSIAPSSAEVDYQVAIVGQVSSLINTIFYTILVAIFPFFSLMISLYTWEDHFGLSGGHF